MDTTEFTPGPWKVCHRRSIHPVGREALAVAVAEQHDKNSEANARLIAAAPEMLAALRETRLQLRYLADKFGETGMGALVLARVNAAIAKATKA